MKRIVKSSTVMLCLLMFLSITYLVLTKDSLYIDTVVYSHLSNYINDTNTSIAKFITFFGSAKGIILITFILLIILKNRKIKVFILSNLVIVTLINQLIKLAISRPRPEINQLVNEFGFSFPSGHSMISLAFYGFLVYLLCKNTNKKKIHILFIVISVILIFLIGLSRIYLGVHYTSDVLAGFVLTLSYLILFISWYNSVSEVNDEK